MAAIKKILLIEDTIEIVRLYTMVLEKAGYEVKTVTDGNDALAAIASYQPDLILLDIMLPHVTGLEILRQLRNDTTLKAQDTLVIIITNLANGHNSREARASGADGYIIKADIVPRDLLAFIDELSS